MASRDLEIKILADGAKAKKEFDQLGREIRDTVEDGKKRFASFSSFAGGALAAIGGAAALGGIARFVGDSVTAAQEAESSQVRLNAAYAQFPAVGDVAIDTLRGLNSELAQKTRFDDDATASGQAVLAQFRLTGSQIQQLTPLLQDYAAKTGKDLPSAATDLGRAILGNGRALRAIGINFADTGSEAGNFESLMGSLRQQVGGFAEQEGQSAAGQAAILSNQLGEVQESIGVALMPALREMSGWMIGTGVPALQDMVTWLTENWSWISATGTAVGTVVGAYALYRGGLAAYAAVTGIATAAQAAYAVASYGAAGASYAGATATGAQAIAARAATIAQWALSGSLGTVAIRAGAAGFALGGLAAVIAIAVARQAQLNADAQEYSDTLDEQTGAVTENTRATIAKKLAEADAFAGALAAGISQKELTDALYEGGAALEDVERRMREYSNTGLNAFDPAVVRTNWSLGAQKEALDASGRSHADYAAATEGATAATDDSADSMDEAADEAAGLNDELATLIENLNKVNGVNQSAIAANARYREGLAGIAADVQKQRDAYEDANGSLDGFSLSLDQNTTAGSSNAASLSQVASQAQVAAQAQFTATEATQGGDVAAAEYNATLAAQRQAFIDSAVQAGYNADEVQGLADKVFSLPPERTINIVAETQATYAAFRELEEYWNNRSIPIRTYMLQQDAAMANRGADGYATGGQVVGPGTGTSDSILAFLSNGEWIVPAEATRKNKAALQFMTAGGTIPGFAGGGPIGETLVAPVAVDPLTFGGARGLGSDAGSGASSRPQTIVLELRGDPAILEQIIDARVEHADGRRVMVRKMGKQAYVS